MEILFGDGRPVYSYIMMKMPSYFVNAYSMSEIAVILDLRIAVLWLRLSREKDSLSLCS